MIGDSVAEGVGRIPGFVNAYVFEDASGVYLVDTTMNRSAKPVQEAFERAGVPLSRIGTILLTHAHVDHIRGAAHLESTTHCPVVCHEADAPGVDGRVPPRLPPVIRWFMKVPPVPVRRTLKDGDMVGPLRVVFTPGHTAGEVAFYHPQRKILFSGDAVVERKGGLTVPAAGFAADLSQAIQSLQILRRLDIELLLPGHGVPVSIGVREKLDALIARAPEQYEKTLSRSRV